MPSREIALITASFPYGKAETFLQAEMPYLSEKFDKVTIFPFSISDGVQRPLPANVIVSDQLAEKIWLTLSLRGLLGAAKLALFVGWPELRRGAKLCGVLNAAKGMASHFMALIKSTSALQSWLVKLSGKQVVYSYWLGPVTIAAAQLRSVFPELRVVSRCHRIDLYEEETDSHFIPFLNTSITSSDRLFCISDHGREYVNQRLPEGHGKRLVSRLGVQKCSAQATASVPPAFHIASCSSLEPQKRPMFLRAIVEGLAERSSGLDLRWTHFGDGSMRSEFLAGLETSMSNLDFEWKGLQPNREVRRFYSENRIDLFLNVSSSEGVPVSIMEAMAAAIPVAATDVGGTSEIVNSTNGILLPKNPSATEVFSLLGPTLHDRNILAAKKAAAYVTWAEKCDARKNYEDFYCRLLAL